MFRDPQTHATGDDTMLDGDDERGRVARGTAPGRGGPRRATVLAVAGAATAMAAVGSSFAVLDTLHDFPASGGQAARYAVAALLLLAIAGGRLPRPTRPQLVRLGLLAFTGLAAFNLLVMAAETSMDPGSVGVIVAAVPVLLALAGPLQDGRRPEPRVVGAAVLVAAGAAVVQGMGGELTVAGLAAALGALACEAAFSLLAAPLLKPASTDPRGASPPWITASGDRPSTKGPALRLARPIAPDGAHGAEASTSHRSMQAKPLGPVAVSAWAAILAVPQLIVIGLVLDGPANFIRAPTLAEAAALAYLTVVVTAMAFVLWYSAVRTLGVERAGLLSGVLPVSALLAAAILGRSELTAGRLAGAVAVGAGIAVGLASARPRRTGNTVGTAEPVPSGAVTR